MISFGGGQKHCRSRQSWLGLHGDDDEGNNQLVAKKKRVPGAVNVGGHICFSNIAMSTVDSTYPLWVSESVEV